MGWSAHRLGARSSPSVVECGRESCPHPRASDRRTLSHVPAELVIKVRFPVDDRVLSALHARAFSYPAPAPSIAVVPWVERLERRSVSWVGAFEGDRLIGFVHACWDGGLHAFLLDAVVEPDRWRRGVGRLVVEQLVTEVKLAGCEWLHVDYEPQFEPFYRSCGFSPTSAGLLRLTP